MQLNRYYRLSVFSPQRLEKHITKSPSRALAIFDILENILLRKTDPIVKIKDALKAGHTSEASALLHQLNNSLGNFGALRVCDVASELEQILSNQPQQDGVIVGLITVLEHEMIFFLEQAGQWLRKQKEQMECIVPEQSTEQTLNEFKAHLLEANFKALDEFEMLRDVLQKQLSEQHYSELTHYMQRLQFINAWEVLQSPPNRQNV